MPEEDKTMIVKMAFLYVQSEEWYKAIEEYKKLLRMDPYDPHVYNMMGDAYAKKKDDKDAFEAYQESRELYSKLGNMAKVAAIDRKVSKLSPDRMDPQQKRLFLTITKSQEAERMAAEGKFDEAVAYFNQLIAAEPINFSYREKLSNLFLDHAHVSEAVAQLKAIADIHLSEGRVDAALAYAGKISLIDPEGIDTVRLMSVLAKKKGDTEGVAKHYGKLAQLAFDAGQYEEAKAAIEEALPAGRGDLKPLLAKVLLALKKPAEAKQQLEALLKENPGDEGLVEQLLSLSEEIKDWNGAYGHITALLQKRPDDPKLQPRLARILLQVGKRAEALQVYMNLALNALKENKAEAAFNYFDNILALEPDNVDVLKKKAEIYLKLGKKQEVIDTYKKLQAAYTQKKMVEEAKRVGLILTKLAGLK
ncbi:MAG TPA: tetratricopeptide repeat protein [bacterium]|nr:tetratricopeptide repeat protein [bacterium]